MPAGNFPDQPAVSASGEGIGEMDSHSNISAEFSAHRARNHAPAHSNALNLVLINMVAIAAIVLAGLATVSLALAQDQSVATVRTIPHSTGMEAG